MEIRPDRFKVVAAKTLGKIYGYVKSLWDNMLKHRKPLPSRVQKKVQLLQLN